MSKLEQKDKNAGLSDDQVVGASTLKGKKGFERWLLASKYSQAGFAAAWKSEAAFREEVLGAIILIPLALYLGETGVEKALMIGSLLLVLLVELLNSAVESVVDRVGEEFHELSGQAKDMGSAAVLLALLIAVITWVLLLL